MGIFDKFKGIKAEDFRDSYKQPIADGQKDVAAFEKKLAAEAAKGTDQGKALTKLQGGISTAEAELKSATASKAKDAAERVTKAKASLGEAHGALTEHLSGKGSVEIEVRKQVTPKATAKTPNPKAKTVTTKVEVNANKTLQDAFGKAEASAAKVTDPASSIFGTARTQKDGWAKAVKGNWNEIKAFKEGTRGVAVARCGVVAGSAIAMGDALFRSKDSNGEDRSAAMRLAEFVVAGGVGTAAAVSGRAIAR